MRNLSEPEGRARATLILDYSDVSKTLKQKLEANGWHTYISNNFREFKRLFSQHRFEVVIIYFNDDTIVKTSDLETLSTLSIITKWIAIVPSEGWLDTHPSILFSHLFYDYHRQPLRYDHLLATIGHAYGMATLQSQKLKRFKVPHNNTEIIGQSKVAEKLRARVSIVAKQDVPVLISGDSGTGKQFISQLLHKKSLTHNQTFASIHCGATPEKLVNSELFGHTKNSLRLDCEEQIGRVEQCHNGTLVLNDIEELPLNAQSSLARYIEQKNFYRVGSTELSTSDCRIIATTSSDLSQLVKKKRFRNDLYQALATTTIELPTLNERHHDIQDLANFFLSQFCQEGEARSFSQCAIEAMQQYHWPGNVRELMNRIRRAIILSDGKLINESHLELPKNNGLQNLTLKDARDKVEKDIVVRTIAQAGYNHSKAAKNLGISRTSLYRLISKHQIPL